MLTERTLHLINAELDGELAPGEQEELDALLQSSAEARAMKAELQKLANLLDAEPERTPPPMLHQRILDRVAGPEPAPRFNMTRLFSSLQPSVGLAFAAGLIVTVAVYEWVPVNHSSRDTANMVGTMMAGKQDKAPAVLDRLVVSEQGMAGEVRLLGGRELLMLEVEIDSTRAAEIEIGLSEAGVVFGGIALARPDEPAAPESYDVSGGTLRVAGHGRQAFTVFLPFSERDVSGGRSITIGITPESSAAISGTLRG